jgi:nucleotide-binding universal stress UspA family protein
MMDGTALEKRGLGWADEPRSIASILCPIDFSDESLVALGHASRIARRSNATLIALYVADPLLVRAAAAAYHTSIVVQDGERALRDAVDRIRRETGEGTLAIVQHVVVGNPATEIARFSSRHDVDLIVMGTHQSAGHGRLLLGSVAEGVLRNAPAPVLFFPSHPGPRASRGCVVVRLEAATAFRA